MKRLFVFTLFSFIIIYSSASDHELSKAVDALNKGDFPHMLEILPNVRDWSFDNAAAMLDEEAIHSLAVLRDSLLNNGDTIPQIDSLVYFVIEELELLSEYQANVNNNFELAISNLEFAMLWRLVIEGGNTKGMAKDWYNEGIIHMNAGKYAKAANDFNESYKIRKSLFGLFHPDVCLSLEAMVWANQEIGNYHHAITCLEELLIYYEHEYGKESQQYITGLDYLSYHHLSSHNLPQAEHYYRETLLCYDRKGDSTSRDYLTAMSNLGRVYSEMGQYDRALKIFLEISDKLATDTLSVSYIYNKIDIGAVYFKMHDYDNAEKYLLLAKTYYESAQANGVQMEDLSLSNHLAMTALKKQEKEKAEYYFMRDAEQTRIKYGESHPQYAQSLINLGYFYEEIHRYSEALDYLAKARMIYDERRVFAGEEHWEYSIVIRNMGVVYMYMKIFGLAAGFFQEYAQLIHERYVSYTNFLSEQQLKMFLESDKKPFEYWFPKVVFFNYLDNPKISTFGYDNELFYKGLLLNSSNVIKNSILESSDSTLIRQWEDLTTKKQSITLLEERNPQSSYLDTLKEETEMLEKEITRKSAAYRKNQAMWQITWDSVRNHLQDNQVAIEYFTAPLNADSTMYCALLLRQNSDYPEMIPLFEEAEAKELISRDAGETYNYDKNGKDLSELVWQHILPKIKPREVVYFAPAGLLHQLAIEALPYDEQHCMGDIYQLVRVSSTREIVMHNDDIQHATATLYGGIQYDVNADTLLHASRQYADRLAGTRNIDADTINRGKADYLPGTKQEIDAINALLSDRQIHVQSYSATEANEESFKVLSGTHQNILHIATHGFFWTDAEAHRRDYFAQRMVQIDNDRPTPPTIDPLSRCGLLMAGANTALQGHSADLPEGVQDGILTAKEISLLDLRDAAIVVLSACETGKGEVTGEGVFGLQRAFKMAGAQTIIMSLWPVSDAATQLLMTEFYHNWITLKQPKREAFRNAQNAVRNYTVSQEVQAGDKSAHQAAMGKFIKQGQAADNADNTGSQTTVATKRPYQEPHYWAGFVMLD